MKGYFNNEEATRKTFSQVIQTLKRRGLCDSQWNLENCSNMLEITSYFWIKKALNSYDFSIVSEAWNTQATNESKQMKAWIFLIIFNQSKLLGIIGQATLATLEYVHSLFKLNKIMTFLINYRKYGLSILYS